MKNWREEHCSSEPSELQSIAPGLFMQRKDIHKVEHEESEGMPGFTEWVCECREITESELNMLKAIEEIDTQEAIDAYTESLIEEGVIA